MNITLPAVSLPLEIAAFLPIVTPSIVGLFQKDNFSWYLNLILAIFGYLGTVAVCVGLSGKFSNTPEGLALVISYALLVMSLPVTQLVRTELFKHVPSPLQAFIKTPDPLASRTVPTTQGATLSTLPSVQAQVQQARYMQYANQQTQVAPAPQGYNVNVPPITNTVPPRASRVASDLTSGGVISNASVPQQQFKQAKRFVDNGG